MFKAKELVFCFLIVQIVGKTLKPSESSDDDCINEEEDDNGDDHEFLYSKGRTGKVTVRL